MSTLTQQLVQLILKRLAHARLRLLQADLTAGLVLLLGSILALWFVFALLESIFWFATPVRWALVAVGMVTVLGLVLLSIVLPLLRHWGLLPGRDELTIARQIGRVHPDVGDRLLNLIQLSQGKHSASPEPFIDQAVQRLAEPMEQTDFNRIASWQTALRYSKWCTAPLLLVIVSVIAAPVSFMEASERIIRPSENFERPAPFVISVEPGNAELITGDDLAVSVMITGILPEETPILETLTEGEMRSRFINLTPDSSGLLLHTYEDVRFGFQYRISSETVTTPWYEVTLVDRPIVQQLNVRLNFPRYSRIPALSLDANVGDVAALKGTSMEIRAALSGSDVTSATVEFESGRSEELIIDGREATGRFTLTRNDTYHVVLESPDGIRNLDPISYRIESMDDALPSATLIAPAPLVDLGDDLTVGLLTNITDDFGFSRLLLHFRLSDSRFGTVSETFSFIEIELDDVFQLDQEIVKVWRLSDETNLDPVPGDVIDYYVEVFDNDGFSGAKSAQTRIHQLRMPSIAERYESLDDSQDDTEASLEQLLDEADEARKQFEELKEQLLENPEADFHEERLLEQLQQKQDALEESVNKVAEKMEELAQQMQENDLVSEDTMNMFEELQEVVEEVRTPELMDALKQLQSAMQNMDMNEMQDALEKFEFSEEMYQERLERTLDLFKKFRVDQDMEEIEERAKDLSETEQRLADETEKLEEEQKQAEDPQDANSDNEQPGERKDELAEEQELAAEEMKALEEKMEEVRKRMEEMDNMPAEEMQDLMEDTQDQEMSQKMKDNAQKMRENELQEAGQEQQKMSEQLDQLSSQMDQMQMSMQGAQMQLNIAAIRSALEDVLTLSERQEFLRLDVLQMSADSPLLRDAAQSQLDLSEGLAITADSLQSIAKEIPQMTRDVQQRAGDAIREMSDATASLTERAARRAAGHQRGAMTNLNELALMLSELLNQQMNGSGTGQSNQSMEQMMEQLQQMGQQQQQLNQQIQQLLNDMQGQRLTQDMTERLRQLGAQQEQMRNEVRQMNRNRDARNKLLGDLNRVADQMMETIEELQQNRVSRRTIQRQQQILTRLLEASRSMEQKGKDDKREGKTVDENLRESPDSLTPNEQAERLRRDLIRALESGYSSDYEALIRRYFDLLQSQSKGVPEPQP